MLSMTDQDACGKGEELFESDQTKKLSLGGFYRPWHNHQRFNFRLRYIAVISDSAGDASNPEGEKTSRCSSPTSASCWTQKSSSSTRTASTLKPWRSGMILSPSPMARTSGYSIRGFSARRLTIDNGALEKIVEQFRYETGVVPVIIH
jgi:hypothetical protein